MLTNKQKMGCGPVVHFEIFWSDYTLKKPQIKKSGMTTWKRFFVNTDILYTYPKKPKPSTKIYISTLSKTGKKLKVT